MLRGLLLLTPISIMAGPPLSRDYVVYYALEPQLWRKVVKVSKQLLRTGSGLGSLTTKLVAPVGVRVQRVRKIVYRHGGARRPA